MTDHDAIEFLARLNMLWEVFARPGAPGMSRGVQTAYFEALRDLPFDDVNRALEKCLKGNTFFPKPIEIRNHVQGDPNIKIEEAWMTWKAAAHHVGSYESWDCDDPVLAETLVAVFGGWPQACTAEYSPEMWTAKRKEFDRVYRALLSRQLVGSRHMPGLIEQDNTTRGYLNAWTPSKELPS